MARKLKIKIVNENANELYMDKNKDERNEDAGLDLYVLEDIKIKNLETVFIDLGIQCEMINEENNYSESYYLYPRSSISKTPLMLANSVGIIDSGYRGNIKAAVKCFLSEENKNEIYKIKKGTRLFQICASNLESFSIEITKELSKSKRGEKGFGSSGI